MAYTRYACPINWNMFSEKGFQKKGFGKRFPKKGFQKRFRKKISEKDFGKRFRKKGFQKKVSFSNNQEFKTSWLRSIHKEKSSGFFQCEHVADKRFCPVRILCGQGGVLQTRTSALFDTKYLGFFKIYCVSAWTRGLSL